MLMYRYAYACKRLRTRIDIDTLIIYIIMIPAGNGCCRAHEVPRAAPRGHAAPQGRYPHRLLPRTTSAARPIIMCSTAHSVATGEIEALAIVANPSKGWRFAEEAWRGCRWPRECCLWGKAQESGRNNAPGRAGRCLALLLRPQTQKAVEMPPAGGPHLPVRHRSCRLAPALSLQQCICCVKLPKKEGLTCETA